jgi:hypothetical protein
MEKKPSRQYRPTRFDWLQVTSLTEFTSNEDFYYHSMELINFETSMVHLKGGRRIGFDCLSEDQYLKVVSGKFYEQD